MAIGNDNGINTVNGNNSAQIYGNQATYGNMSPQMALIQLLQQALHRPAREGQRPVGAGPRQRRRPGHPGPVQPQNQQCTENSTQAKGDEALSHILDNIPVLSGNASAGS